MDWKIILYIVLAIVFLFVLYLVVNAFICKTKRKELSLSREKVSKKQVEIYSKKLQRMLQCKTISTSDNVDKEEFIKFRKVLREEFPLLHSKADFISFDGCLVFIIKGKNPTKNIMLMSHHDVVDVKGDWKYPPFAGVIKNGVIHGRGTVDTKTSLFGELMAIEELLNEGYEFEGMNLYLASSNNEEANGEGIPKAVKYFKEKGIHFDVVLDEGGAIVEKMIPGVKQKSAMIAVHEKGRFSYKCIAKATVKGHASLNANQDNAIERMSKFINEIKSSKIFRKYIVEEVEDIFVTHAPYMSFGYRLLFANFKIFKGLLKIILPKVSSNIGAMLSTSVSFNKISGGNNIYISAEEVVATAYFRCLRKEMFLEEMEKFTAIAKKYDIEVVSDMVDYCTPSNKRMSQYKKLEEVINKTFPDVIVSPFLLTAGTDARHTGDIADAVLRFAPMDLTSKQYATIHNTNENINLSSVAECVVFYKNFIKDYNN